MVAQWDLRWVSPKENRLFKNSCGLGGAMHVDAVLPHAPRGRGNDDVPGFPPRRESRAAFPEKKP